MLAIVSAFREPWEAHMFCARLNAEGIPACVAHENHVGIEWYLSVALGGVKVQVPRDRWAEAREIETMCRNGGFVPLLEREFGALEAVHCPKCGSTEYRKRRPLPRAAAAIAISLLIGPLLPPLGWIYFCEKCAARYRAPLCPMTAKLPTILFVVASELVLLAIVTLSFASLFTRHWLLGAIVAVMLLARWLVFRVAKSGETDS